MTNTIYATFSDPAMATKAAGALLDHGVRNEHISIIFPDGYQVNRGETGMDLEKDAKNGITTTTSADVAKGAERGAGIGVVAGALAALAAIFVPGVGLVIGGGALAMALGGMVATTAAGAVAGGFTGLMADMGVPKDAVEHYSTVIRGGGALIAVAPTDENIDTASIEALLQKYSGVIYLSGYSTTAGQAL